MRTDATDELATEFESEASTDVRPLCCAALEIGQEVDALAWSPSGNSFAAAARTGAGRRTRDAAKAQQVSVVVAFSVHEMLQAGDATAKVSEVWRSPLRRDAKALCFCGNGCLLAVAEFAFFSPAILVFSLDAGEQVHKIIMPSSVSCLSFAPGDVLPPSVTSTAPQLIAGSGNCVAFCDCKRDPRESPVVSVSHTVDELRTLRQDIRFEGESACVAFVKPHGAPASLGVRGGQAWILTGWKEPMGALVTPQDWFTMDQGLTALSRAKAGPVSLYFQRPLTTAAFPHRSQVRCAEVSPDGTCLAIGCSSICGAGLKEGAAPHRSKVPGGGSRDTVTLWGLETRLCRHQLRLRKDARAVHWVSSTSLLVAHGNQLTLLNSSTGGIERSWTFRGFDVFCAAAPYRPLAVVALGGVDVLLCRLDGASSEAVFPLQEDEDAIHDRGRFACDTLVVCSAGGDQEGFASVAVVDRSSRRLRIWRTGPLGFRGPALEPLGDEQRAVQAIAIAPDGSQLAVCVSDGIRRMSWVEVFDAVHGQQLLSCQEHEDTLACVAVCSSATVGHDGSVLVAAGAGLRTQGFVCWFASGGSGGGEPIRAPLHFGFKVVAVALSAQGHWLACALERKNAVHVCDLMAVGQVSDVLCLAVELPPPLECMAFGGMGVETDGNAHAHAHAHAHQPLEPAPALLALGSKFRPQVAVHELATGLRYLLDVSSARWQDSSAHAAAASAALGGEGGHFAGCDDAAEPSGVGSLSFGKHAGNVLAVGTRGGHVRLFEFAQSGGGLSIMSGPRRRLKLGGCVHGLALRGQQLANAACLRESAEGCEVVVYDLVNPTLLFMLGDLPRLSAEEFREQLALLPTLLHQHLEPCRLQWSLMHWVTANGFSHHARTLVELAASPIARDANSQNALDVALQHHHYGVVEELLRALTEQARAAWSDSAGDGGRDTVVARGLPSEHSALTKTVVRLLKHRIPVLPEFIDVGCSGAPEAPPDSPAPRRVILKDGEMRLAAAAVPVYRSEALPGLVPVGAAAEDERPAKVRVWYLRGAFDRDVGMLRALMKAEQHDVLRTNFASALLQHKWRMFAKRHFFYGLVAYVTYLAMFLAWSVFSPRDGEQGGAIFQVSRVVLVGFTAYYLREERRQFAAEKTKLRYFSIWNVFDLSKIALVAHLVVWSFRDPRYISEGSGRGVVAFTAVVAWGRLLSFGRGYFETGHLIRTLVAILGDMRIFTGLMLILVCGFAHAFYALCSLRANDGVLKALMFVYYQGIIGELVELDDCKLDSPEAYALYLCLTAALLVVMLNFLIAVMSDSFNRTQQNADVSRNLMRAELIYEVEALGAKDPTPPQTYLFVCQQAACEGSGDGEHAQLLRAEESRVSAQQLSEQRDRLVAIESQVKAIGDRLQGLESTVIAGQTRMFEQVLDLLRGVNPSAGTDVSFSSTPHGVAQGSGVLPCTLPVHSASMQGFQQRDARDGAKASPLLATLPHAVGLRELHLGVPRTLPQRGAVRTWPAAQLLPSGDDQAEQQPLLDPARVLTAVPAAPDDAPMHGAGTCDSLPPADAGPQIGMDGDSHGDSPAGSGAQAAFSNDETGAAAVPEQLADFTGAVTAPEPAPDPATAPAAPSRGSTDE